MRTRRTFLAGVLGTTGVALLVACTPGAPVAVTTPTTAPPKPTDAPAKPAAPVATTAPTAPSSAASPVAKPAAAASLAPVPSPSAAATGATQVQPLARPAAIRMTLNTANTNLIPLFWAIDHDLFKKANIDLQLTKFNGSMAAQIPTLAKGDMDITSVGSTPPLFNQLAQGFDIKLVSSVSIERPGRLTSGWLTVLKDKAGEIKDLKDLRGKVIDGAAQGSVLDFLAQEALIAAGLKPSDVTLQYRARAIPDMLALAQAKGADVIGMSEPTATQAQDQGLVVKWKGFADIVPWYTPNNWAASAKYLETNRTATQKFVEVYLSASRVVNAANGEWTPELSKMTATWTGVPEDTVKAIGKVPYFDPNGAVSIESLAKTLEFWVSQDVVKQTFDVNQLVDLSVARDALGAIGRAPDV